MEINITKPPIPLLWIDTWRILDLVKALNGKDPVRRSLAERTVNLIIKLTREKKLICPEGDQGDEIEVSNNETLVENARRLQAQISQGISLHYYATVEDMQIQRMIEAFVKNKDSIIFPWKDIFADDPIAVIDRKDQFIVSVHIPFSRKKLNERIALHQSIAADWEVIRQEALRNKQKYQSKLEQEFGGKAEVFIHVLRDLAVKTIAQQEIDIDTMIRVAEITGRPLAWWERYSGKKDDIKGLVAFFQSEEYKLIPSVRVGTKLLAELVSGNEIVSQGDVMDIHHMSTILPFASYLVVDKRVKNRIEGKTKLIKEYDFKLLKWQELLPFLEKLDKLH